MEKRKPGRPSTNDSRRTEILEKAAKCFSLNGYDKTTLDDIGHMIGFNKAALYYYFKNKEELFQEVFKNEIQNGLSNLHHKIENISSPEDKILYYFRARTDVFINLFNMHSLSNDNMINLTNSFLEKYKPYKHKEIQYVAIFFQQVSKYSNEEALNIVNMLFEVSEALTFTSYFATNMSKDENTRNIVKDKKEKILRQLILSYKKN